MFDFTKGKLTRADAIVYIKESLESLPMDILLLLYRIIACSESGLE
jgi:hypothetical protein